MSAAVAPTRVCLVTDELFPLTAGGIGRLAHNLIEDALQRGAAVEFHVLTTSGSALTEAAVKPLFGGRVTLHRAEHLDSPSSRQRWGAAYPPRLAFSDTPAHADSLELMLALKRLEQDGVVFDVVEFPDFLGWAFCSIQERRLAGAFASTQLSVRLHSTAGLIQAAEGTRPSLHEVGTFELERRSLQEADLVVAHLAGAIEQNARFYGFDDAWKSRVRVEFPPVCQRGANARATASGDLAFVTKVQRCKRPDLFTRAAVLHMRRHPEWAGKAVFACHLGDDEGVEALRALIPSELQERFLFAGPDARERWMRAVVVIPSDLESLNLAAYEAAALGANLVLNERCVAFGKTSPFINGVNCWTFDGTVDGLSQTLETALQEGRPGPLEWTSQPAYFERRRPAERAPAPESTAKVSVLVTNYNLGAYLPRCLESVAASSHANIEVILVDDASTHPDDALVLDAIEKRADPRVKVVRNGVNRGLSASRNLGLRHCTGEYVVPLDADDVLAPDFLARAARSLDAHLEFSVVVPTLGYFLTDSDLDAKQFCDFAVFLGNVPSLGLVANRLSSATAMVRRTVFDRFTYDEGLDSFEDWSLWLRLSHAGLRFLVTNELAFFYRRRDDSMARSISPERRQRLMARLYATLPVAAPGVVHLEVMAASGRGESAPPAPTPLRYALLDEANAFIKRTPMHRLIRRNLESLTTSRQRPLRYELMDRLAEVLSRFKRS